MSLNPFVAKSVLSVALTMGASFGGGFAASEFDVKGKTVSAYQEWTAEEVMMSPVSPSLEERVPGSEAISNT